MKLKSIHFYQNVKTRHQTSKMSRASLSFLYFNTAYNLLKSSFGVKLTLVVGIYKACIPVRSETKTLDQEFIENVKTIDNAMAQETWCCSQAAASCLRENGVFNVSSLKA